MPKSIRAAAGGWSVPVLVCVVCWCAVAAPARADDAVTMVIDLVTGDDVDMRAIGLDRIRHGAKGEAATRAFAALLETQPAARLVEIVRALSDRGDPAALPALVALLERTPDATVRAGVIAALGVLGRGPEVPVLMKCLAADEPERTAARRALVAIQGDEAVAQLVAAAKSGAAPLRVTMVAVLGERRVRSALPDLAVLATDEDAAVRRAALKVLGGLGGVAEVPAMVASLLRADPGAERQEAERAIIAVCTRNPGSEAAADAFLKAFRAAAAADQEALLTTLGGIGGPAALAIVDDMIASPDAARRSLGLKALSRWPDATVAPRLLDLLAAARDPAERDLLVGVLIRIAPLPDNKLNDAQKLDLVKKTMALCTTDAERARLLERASAIRTFETFQFVVPYLDQPALAAAACKGVVELAHHRNLRDAHKPEFMAALDTVLATTQDAELVERATRYKEGKTWERKR